MWFRKISNSNTKLTAIYVDCWGHFIHVSLYYVFWHIKAQFNKVLHTTRQWQGYQHSAQVFKWHPIPGPSGRTIGRFYELFAQKLTAKYVECTVSFTLSAACDTCSGASPSSRVDCGYPGISAGNCESRGCCFDNSVTNVHWCFFPRREYYFLPGVNNEISL